VVCEVNRVLVAAETRAAIEDGVCETLAAADPYLFAWVGEYDAAADEVVARASAGAGEGYLAEISISVADAETLGPTARAVRTGEVQTVQHVRADPDYGPWREPALERGFESSAAIPVANGEASYGVLNVYSERPAAFGEDERALLAELGETIATAVAGVEARQELAERTRTFERLAERVSDAYYAVDGEWRVTYWNDRMAERTDTPASSVVGEVLWEVFPEMRGSENERQYRAAMADGEPRSFETYLPEPYDYWVEVDVYPDESGLSILSREVTERKERERELQRYERIFESIPLAVGQNTLGADAEITDVNRAAVELFDAESAAELEGLEPEALYADDEGRERFAAAVREDGAVVGEEYDFQTLDGERFRGELTATVEAVDGERVVVASITDVTERVERERELAENDAILRQLTEATDDVFFLFDGAFEQLLFVNDAYEEVWGQPVERLEADPTAFLAGIHPEDRDRVKTAMKRIAEGERTDVEYRVNPDEEYDRWVAVRSEPVVADGAVQRVAGFARDVTERKERERELEQSRAFLERVQAVADIGGWEVDFRTDELEWTAELYRIHGVSTDYEPTVAEGIDFYHPEDRPAIRAALEGVREECEGYDLELRIVTAGDEVRWVRALGEPVCADGEVVGARGVLRDITERKERERELEQANRRLNAIVENTSEVVFIKDREGVYQLINQAGAELFGCEPADVVGQTDAQLFDGESAAAVRAVDQEILATGRPVNEETVRYIDGERHVFLDNKFPYRGPDGEVVGIIGVSRDITERERRERELQTVTERLNLAVEGANLGVWDWNVETDEVTFNDRWAEMLGFAPEEIEPSLSAWKKRVHPDDMAAVEAELDAHFAGETDRYDCEHRMRTADGEWKWVRDVGKVVKREERGDPLRAVGIHIDIDDRKRAEAELQRQRDSLELLNEMVRHDIRNDLQVILLYAGLLADETTDTAHEHAERIVSNAETAISLTETARDLAEAMLQSERDAEPVALRTVLEQQLTAVRSAHEAALVTTAGPLPSVTVMGDDMLASVFRNLLTNAVQHNDKAVPEVRVGVTESETTVTVCVADNGPGVPESQQTAIFGRGEKGLESEGSGIGLYLVDTLVTDYGGDVWVRDREPGEFGIDGEAGAVFCVELRRPPAES
jgi:PAS domain S-box-containing protein